MCSERALEPPRVTSTSDFARRACERLLPHWGLWLVVIAMLAATTAWIVISPQLDIDPYWIAGWLAVAAGGGLTVVVREWRAAVFDRFLDALFSAAMVLIFAWLLSQALLSANHASMSLAMPLADPWLISADRLMGFDWNGYAQWVAGHPLLRELLLNGYNHFIGVVLGAIVIVSIWRCRFERVNELAYLATAAGFICLTVSAMMPSESAWNTLGLPGTAEMLGGQPGGNWLSQFHALRSGLPVTINAAVAAGLSTFPSFHTCLGLMMVWCSRGSWLGGLAGGVSGLTVVAATPVFGGHYLIDVAAGTALMAGLVLAWNRWSP